MAEILFVDDDTQMRKSIRALLEGEGYAVRLARDGKEAIAQFREKRSDLILLDVMMPHLNGNSACVELRREDPLVPILFFTSAPSEAGLVRGLGGGADDYIDKACPPEELLARIAAALRRRDAERAQGPASEILRLGGVSVDLGRLSLVDGTDLHLTKSEVDLLRLLDSDRGRYFTKDEIFTALRGEDYVGDYHAIRNAVWRLKLKLGPAGDLLEAKRGVGYRLLREAVR